MPTCACVDACAPLWPARPCDCAEVIASRPYTYASDIWSLGCVLYEMATRRTAFEAFGLPQLMVRLLLRGRTMQSHPELYMHMQCT